jgi:hypothetical protein
MNEFINIFGYIYIRNHISYDINNVVKMGKTINIPERDNIYATGEPTRGYFEAVYEVDKENMGIIEKILQIKFSELNFKGNGGTEFYDKNIIQLIEPYLISLDIYYRKLDQIEINNLVRQNRVSEINEINETYEIQRLINKLKTKRTNTQYIWNERDYQTKIINYSKDELLLNNKLYIELPTGAGKSFIVYNILKYLQSEFIIIVSPRKIVNLQNISQKYLQILKDNFDIFNYSSDYNIDKFLRTSNKKIIICCTQTIDKIYEKILLNLPTNIAIWFDEAHWGIEEWINNLDNDVIKQFWLLNNNIKYRIFTSASPNKEIITQNENIFGKLYSPIKVKELIDLNWLSEIKTYIYSENIENVDNINYIINDFIEKNRTYGFSFHNKQGNAFNLFYKHYIQYKNNRTHIKPFLLVSDNYTIERERKLQDILLEYNYRDIKIYENTPYSIGYVVAQYSMGYDFNKLDFIYFSDPKLSIKDIKQSIGRGIRPDELGENGKNKEKILNILLPIYIDDKGDNKYGNIIDVLQYLLYDIQIPFKDIEFKNSYTSNIKEGEYKINDYDGINDVKSILLNLLELENKRTTLGLSYGKARKIIADKNIKSKESYYELCERDNRLPKEPEKVFKGQFTSWIEYFSIDRIYYDLETCKNKVGEYLLLYPELKQYYMDLSVIRNELCKIDVLFPPNELWIEYYNVKDLRDIITIINKKKQLGIIL